MSDQHQTLHDLSDRDLIANLWLTVVMIAEDMQIDPAACEQTLIRMEQSADDMTDSTTLSALLNEAQRRIGLQQTGPGQFEPLRTQ